MAVVYHSNNQLLPANQRNADVASSAISGIASVMQQRNIAAFRVQGIEACLYNHLSAGHICSCQGKSKKINSRLNEEGKASQGFINGILTGETFNTSQFGIDDSGLESYVPETADYPAKNDFLPSPEDTNPDLSGDLSLDEIVGDFDASALGITDSTCPICFGTGYIGGFSLYNGFRLVIPCEEFTLPADGELLIQNTPFSAKTTYAAADVVLPKGTVSVDAFRLLNGFKIADSFTVLIDGLPVSANTILAKSDGRKHTVTIVSSSRAEFTHLEIQLNLSAESVYMEVPKLNKSSSVSILDSTDPFQILLSPNIPHVDKLDIITESMWGKALMVQDVSWHNTKERQMLGWECNARVVQQQEVFNFLPRRQRIATKQQTTNAAIGNMLTRF